jgi:hypothetical protein
VDRSKLRKFIRRIAEAEILTANDTADMPHFKERYPDPSKYSMHWMWGTAMLWRCFSSHHTWRAFIESGALPLASEPRWEIVEKVLAAYEDDGETTHGGYFYTPILTHYRQSEQEEYNPVAHLPTATRETLAYKTMWSALPKTELAALKRDPCRDSFQRALEKFGHNLYGKHGLTKGKFNDYALKIMLDALLVNKTIDRNIISTWPMNCPAYKRQLPILFRHIKPSQYFKAACYLHYLIYARHHFHLGDTLAQLCWIEREVN